jgi:hypothetical protein
MNTSKAVPNLLNCVITVIAAMSAVCPTPVLAAPEEIQVYLDEFAEKGKMGLDLHTVYTASTRDGSNVPPRHQLRLTPELSYGLSDHFEVAGYLLNNKTPGRSPQSDGLKARLRWRPIVPNDDTVWYAAVNVELGKLARRFSSEGSNGEVKGILVWKSSLWTAGLNLNLDRPLRRRTSAPVTSEIDGKLAYKVKEDWQFGIERYEFLGALKGRVPGFMPAHTTFLVSDFAIGKWDLNLGIGWARGDVPDRVLLKAIIGVPI